jgi:hypothetical protein
VVLETCGDKRAPIILGRPFISTVKAIIYMDSSKICFTIKDKMEKFSFKNHILQSPSHPQKAYLPEEMTITKKKNNRRRRKNKTRQPQEETINRSTHSDQSTTTFSLHHSLPRRMILVYR